MVCILLFTKNIYTQILLGAVMVVIIFNSCIYNYLCNQCLHCIITKAV